MNNKPVISIVIPVYNVEKYLEDCINSVCNQTYKQLEIIMVDDGSTDNSGLICEELAHKDNRIKIIHQKNMGLSGARNTGIDVATGDFLFFLDSDDFLVDRTIEVLVDMSVKYNADLVACNNERCSDEDSYKLFAFDQNNINTEVIDDKQKMKVFLTESKIKVVAWGKLYKRNLFSNVRFPVGKYNEDNFTTYKIVHAAHRIVVTDFKGYVYRISALSITHQSFKLKHWDDVEGKLDQLAFVEQYYPGLITAARAAVVYACNQVLFLMGASGIKETSMINEAKKYYRRFEIAYLSSNAHWTAKVFSIVAYINPYLALKIAQIIKRK